MTLLFHGYTGAVDLVSSRIAGLLEEGRASDGGFKNAFSSETLDHLKARGYLTEKSAEAEQRYVVELGGRVHQVLQKHAAPGFLFVPTYSCNLRCTYCYEKELQRMGPSWLERRMSAEMIEAALEAAGRIDAPHRRQRCLTLYGGEPLQKANEATIRLLHQRAFARGFRQFSAITNAVDLNHYTDLLGRDGKISFLQVTMDGPPAVHDGRRFLPGGGGTFERIVRNIDQALRRGVRISVRVNVDRENAGLVGWLRDFFLQKAWNRNPLFRAYCSPVHGGICGRPQAGRFASHLEMHRAISAEDTSGREDPAFFPTDALTHAVKERILAHLLQKNDLPFWRTAFCGSNLAMYLFDPFGDIYPCWEVIGHPEHRIGRYGPGFLDLDAQAARRWHHRSVVQIAACRSCPYLFFCGGGCEAFAYRATGRLDQPHCLEFPGHFEQAARVAYREWSRRNADRTFSRRG
jgi:uncharacterized protein